MTEKLGTALRQMREAMAKEGVSPEEALADAVDEFGYRPELLRRKFAEVSGASPEDWLAQRKAAQAGMEAMQALKLDAAVRKAKEVTSKWTMPEYQRALVGRPFTLHGKRYVLLARAYDDDPSWGIRAIGVEDCHLVTMPLAFWPEIGWQVATP